MAAHRQRQRITRRTSRRPSNDVGGDAEPRVVIDTGHDLGLRTIGELHTTNDVHLPQLHRPRPLPTLVVRPLPLTRLRRDQPLTHQTPIDRRQRRQRLDTVLAELMPNRARTPARMLTTQPNDPSFNLGRHLMRTRQRPRRTIDKTGQTLGRVPAQPLMNRLSRHPVAAGHIGDRRPVVQHLEHCLISLFHDTQLHDHQHRPPRTRRAHMPVTKKADRDRQAQVSASYRSHCRPATEAASQNCHPPTEATLSSMNRSRTADEACATRPAGRSPVEVGGPRREKTPAELGSSSGRGGT